MRKAKYNSITDVKLLGHCIRIAVFIQVILYNSLIMDDVVSKSKILK